MTATVHQVNTCPAWTGDRLHTRGHRDICWLRQDAAQSGNEELRFDTEAAIHLNAHVHCIYMKFQCLQNFQFL